MLERFVTKARKWALILAALSLGTAFSGSAYAADIFNGMRGPTNWQADSRLTWSKNTAGVNARVGKLVIKYWDGENTGKWGLIGVPYKFLDTSNDSRSGLGDISAVFGPRGSIGNLYLCPYGGFTFPTGQTTGVLPLGSGRYDVQLGLLTTYLSSGKQYEIDGSFEYRFTGENHQGINPPNQVSAGLLGGGRLTDQTRLVTGLESLIKDDRRFLLTSRTILRHTVSSRFHSEIIGDIGIASDGIPQANSITVQARYNF